MARTILPDTAASESWKVIARAWRTTRAPVFLLGDASITCQAVDQLELQAAERPVGHGLRQFDAAQEGGQIVGQRVQVQPDLVVAELPA